MAENDDFTPMFGKGAPNEAFAQYFIGNSFLNPLTSAAECGVGLANVTFEPGCRNNWHVHHATKGGGQILIVTDGRGWYQERRRRQLVQPHRLRGTGRGMLQRVARARGRRLLPAGVAGF